MLGESFEKEKNFSSRKQIKLFQLTQNTCYVPCSVFTGKGTKESRSEISKNMEIIPWNGDVLKGSVEIYLKNS